MCEATVLSATISRGKKKIPGRVFLFLSLFPLPRDRRRRLLFFSACRWGVTVDLRCIISRLHFGRNLTKIDSFETLWPTAVLRPIAQYQDAQERENLDYDGQGGHELCPRPASEGRKCKDDADDKPEWKPCQTGRCGLAWSGRSQRQKGEHCEAGYQCDGRGNARVSTKP